MKRRKHIRSLGISPRALSALLLIAISLAIAPIHAQAAGQRQANKSQKSVKPLPVDVAVDTNQIEKIVPSPDGELIAYWLSQAQTHAPGNRLTTGNQYNKQGFPGLLKGDVWIINTTSLEKRPVTDGAGNVCGEPVWSPDGSKLAFCSISSGPQRLWILGSCFQQVENDL